VRPPAGRGGLGQAVAEEFSAQVSVGGVRGLLEAVLPLTVFTLVYGLTGNVPWSVAAALAPAVLLAGWRLLTREPLTQVLSGLPVLALGGYLAVRTGRAENMFVPGMVKNAAFAVPLAISALIRRPLLGFFIALLRGETGTWLRAPQKVRLYTRITWLWTGMFALRLAVQLPLWLAGAVTALGLVNIPLGVPLYAAVLWATWRMVQADHVPVAGQDPADGPAVLTAPDPRPPRAG
jgi:hypothetical protein